MGHSARAGEPWLVGRCDTVPQAVSGRFWQGCGYRAVPGHSHRAWLGACAPRKQLPGMCLPKQTSRARLSQHLLNQTDLPLPRQPKYVTVMFFVAKAWDLGTRHVGAVPAPPLLSVRSWANLLSSPCIHMAMRGVGRLWPYPRTRCPMNTQRGSECSLSASCFFFFEVLDQSVVFAAGCCKHCPSV